MERFCQMRWVRQVPLTLRPLDNSSIGCANGGGATDALALPPVCFRATLRFKDRFLPCPTNTLVNTRQRRRFAQAALKLCGSLEQRRDLGTCPTFIPLNAELVACCTSRQRTSRQRTSRQRERDYWLIDLGAKRRLSDCAIEGSAPTGNPWRGLSLSFSSSD
jgi:hypothetical protein